MKAKIRINPDLLMDFGIQKSARHLANLGVFRAFLGENVRQEIVMRVVVSGLLQVWGYVKANSIDNIIEDMELDDIDIVTGIPGFGESMHVGGWVQVNIGFLKFPDIEADEKVAVTPPPPPPQVRTVLNYKEPKYTDEFIRFWDAYPKKVGKGAAWDQWKKIRPSAATVNDIMHAVEAQKRTESWKKDKGQFIPHPSTWLHQRRWEDVPERFQQDEQDRKQNILAIAQRRREEEKTRATAEEVQERIRRMKQR